MVVLSALRVRLLTPAREETTGDSQKPASLLLAGLTMISPASSTPLMANNLRIRRPILEGFLLVSFGFAAVRGIFSAIFLFLILKTPHQKNWSA